MRLSQGPFGFVFTSLILAALASLWMPRAAHASCADPACALVEEGFENVAVAAKGDELIVTYENRRYRYELRALQRAMQLVIPIADAYQRVTFVPRNHDVPLLNVTVPVEEYHSFVSGELAPESFARSLAIRTSRPDPWIRDAQRVNRSHARVDALIHPAVAVEFGNFADPIESQINLVPELQAALWRGASVRTQLIIPIQNELAPEDGDIRPGLLSINQIVRLPGNVFVGATAGYFTQRRYGFDVGARVRLLNGRLFAGGDLGYTGYLTFRDGTWLYDALNVYTPSVTAGYRLLPQYDLTAQVTYGRFLYQDTGLRVDVTRAFGEVQIRLFGIVGEGSDNVGFSVSVPFFGSRYARPARLRFRPPRAIGYAYRYRNLPLEGITFETGFDLDQADLGLNADFIRNRLPFLKGWRGSGGSRSAAQPALSGPSQNAY